MTDDELRKLAEAALTDDKATTPGPWHRERVRVGGGDMLWRVRYDARGINEGAQFNVCMLDSPEGGDPQMRKNAKFIAAARTREPELARAVLDLLRYRAAVERALDDASGTCPNACAGDLRRTIEREMGGEP